MLRQSHVVLLQVTTSGLASLARLPFNLGVSAGEAGRARRVEPEKPIKLYEFEACPFCRRGGASPTSQACLHRGLRVQCVRFLHQAAHAVKGFGLPQHVARKARYADPESSCLHVQ